MENQKFEIVSTQSNIDWVGRFFKDLGDNLIYNDFEINVSVTAKAA